MDSISSWFPTINRSFHIFSTTRPFVVFSHKALSAIVGNLLFSAFLTSFCHIYFPASLFALRGYIPSFSSLFSTALSIAFEHPLAAAISTASSCITNFVLPSHGYPACSSLGTVAFSTIPTLIIASRRESVGGRIYLAHLCFLSFPVLSAMLAPQEKPFAISVPRYASWSTVGHSSSPHFGRTLFVACISRLTL